MKLTLQFCWLVFLWKICEFLTIGFLSSTLFLVPCCSSAPFEDFLCRLELLLTVALFKMIFTLVQ